MIKEITVSMDKGDTLPWVGFYKTDKREHVDLSPTESSLNRIERLYNMGVIVLINAYLFDDGILLCYKRRK